jgi:hypothetical protein
MNKKQKYNKCVEWEIDRIHESCGASFAPAWPIPLTTSVIANTKKSNSDIATTSLISSFHKKEKALP